MSEVRKRLAQASTALGNVLTDSSGQYDNRYASLARVLDAVRPALKDAGLSLVQDIDSDGDDIGVRTVFVDIETGEEWATGRVSFPGVDPQRASSAVTYARRFQLLGALGLSSTDDDAAAASAPQGDPRAIPRPKGATDRPASRKAIVALMAAMTESGLSEREARLAFCIEVIGHDISSSNDLTGNEVTRVLRVLDERASS